MNIPYTEHEYGMFKVYWAWIIYGEFGPFTEHMVTLIKMNLTGLSGSGAPQYVVGKPQGGGFISRWSRYSWWEYKGSKN